MKVLITGGAGLVGSHAAEYYAKKGWDVVVLDNLMRSKLFGYDKKSVEYNWNYLEKYKNIKKIKGDVREEKDTMEALGKGVDAVIHTAGQPGGRRRDGQDPPARRQPRNLGDRPRFALHDGHD